MFAYLWPIGLIILSNLIYHVCAKEVPKGMDTFISLTICYGLGAVVVFVCFFISSGGGIAALAAEYAKANWTPILIGLSVVGLEAGYVFAYKSGWEVSMTYIVQASILSVILLMVGYVLYNEGLAWNKLAGIAICLAGLVMLNRK